MVRKRLLFKLRVVRYVKNQHIYEKTTRITFLPQRTMSSTTTNTPTTEIRIDDLPQTAKETTNPEQKPDNQQLSLKARERTSLTLFARLLVLTVCVTLVYSRYGTEDMINVLVNLNAKLDLIFKYVVGNTHLFPFAANFRNKSFLFNHTNTTKEILF